MIVVDASVAVKWLIDESQSDTAASLLRSYSGQLAGPQLLLIEVAGAIVRRSNMGELTRADAYRILDTWTATYISKALIVHRTDAETVWDAAQIAIDLRHPLKDCVYLALAIQLDCDLVTCDERFRAKTVRLYGRVRLLDEFAADRAN